MSTKNQYVMNDYNKNIYQLLSTILDEEDIYDFNEDRNSRYFKAFQETYDFYRKVMNTLEDDYFITPHYLIFLDSTEINAWADKIGDAYIIAINKGFIEYSFDKIDSISEIFDNGQDADFNELRPLLDSPYGILTFQLFLHFVFYHEYAHLIQFSVQDFDKKRAERVEQVAETDYEIWDHIFEIDADTFASIYISQYIISYAERLSITGQHFEKLLIISCSSILVFFLSLNQNPSLDQLYLYEHTHPHFIPRILNILTQIVRHCIGQQRESTSNDIPTNENNGSIESRLIIDVVRFVDTIFQLDLEGLYAGIASDEESLSRITEYLPRITNSMETSEQTALAIRNKKVPPIEIE